ncbi:MAG: histidine kinase [Rhizobacter sp.]|nr:histidine kinase [Rhizobacter sp.]
MDGVDVSDELQTGSMIGATVSQNLGPVSIRPVETPEDIARDVAAIARLDSVETILSVLCDITGMGFAAVARVSDASWTACATKNDIGFDLVPGGQLPLHSTLCHDVHVTRTAILISHASENETFRNHHTPRIYGIESYVSVPIVLQGGEYFGNLCAIDPKPADLDHPSVLSVFTRFAKLIAAHVDNERRTERVEAALFNEQAAVGLRDEFMAILGHDLRNPLSAVLACSQMLQRKSTDPTTSQLAAHIGSSVKRMSLLIDDMLDLTRGRLGGGIAMDPRHVPDLQVALADVAVELRDAHPDRTIECELTIASDVFCDRGRMQQLASNLMANAITHGDPGGPVRLSATTDEQSLVLEVWNDGEPIPPDSLALIFKPFWRNAMSTERHGLGLGLYICDLIVKSHHGEMSVTSSQASGTRFTIRIPLSTSRAAKLLND